MLKIADVVFSLVLLMLAVIQLNDPDPLFWFGLYSVCALTPLLTIVHAPNAPIFWTGVGFCLAGATLTAAAPPNISSTWTRNR